MDEGAREYIDRIDAAFRPLFDRFEGLIHEVAPDAVAGVSYGMIDYRVGQRRLHIGVWKHGLSLYGWSAAGDGGFTERHPELVSGKGTIRIRPDDAEGIDDDELRSLVAAILGPQG